MRAAPATLHSPAWTARRPATPAPPSSALPVPPVAQPNGHTCGAASTLAVLRLAGRSAGHDVRSLARSMGATSAGTEPWMIVDALRAAGLGASASERLGWLDLVEAARAGRPTLVCYEAYVPASDPRRVGGVVDWRRVDDYGHWSVVVAADDRGVWLMDPNQPAVPGGALPRGFVPRAEFLARFYGVGKACGSGVRVELPAGAPGERHDVRATRLVA